MKDNAMKLLSGALLLALALPAAALADEQALQMKVDELTKKVDKLEDKSLSKWLTIGGDFRFRVDSLRGEAPAFSSAIGTMQQMTTNFLLDPTVATGANGIPSATAFMLAGEPGKLFSSSQLNTILGSYMPQAMFNFLTVGGNSSAFNQVIGQYMTAAGGSVDAALAAHALSAQQSGILNTLIAKGVFDSVLAKLGGGNLAAGQAAFQNMIGQLAANLGTTPDKAALLANTALLQSFLGAGSPNLKTVPASKPKNDSLYTNRLGIDLHAKATKDITVNVRLVAYKTFGSQDDSAVTNGGATPYFADRVGVFDGTIGHIPSSSLLEVDRAYATWSNILDQPVWLSVGRRPSTNGAPSNIRLNNERPGNGGTPALLVDYAFDGMTIGWAPDIEALPGAYAKVCYGRAFESGLDKPSGNSLNDTDMLGIAVIPIDTDPLRVWLQWNRGMDIFDFPVQNNTFFGNTGPSVNLGSIDWYGAGFMSTLKNIGPGKLNFFGDAGMSITHPNNNVSANAGFEGLMTGQFFDQEAPTSKTGWAAYVGARYDFDATKTKLGVEYNHGSKNWITFAPAADDMWTSKLGTRGDVYEVYLIQELNLKPISSYLSKAFFRVGYQYYNFDYTGSNNWVGAPVKIADIKSTDLMLLSPLKNAQDIYATFEVKF
jgi:hypothetical protein